MNIYKTLIINNLKFFIDEDLFFDVAFTLNFYNLLISGTISCDLQVGCTLFLLTL